MANEKRAPKLAVSRAGGKLEAALERFGLGDAVRGAAAVDVGASTGGFTEVLLARGARRVLAADVGHGQLHERLRGDPRVESLEGADWKRLPLAVAPGPFDFFTVDVSFIAARSMLRGLAFRLRAGAEGVVLIKPQFELPDRMVKDGDVSAPALRSAAIDRFAKKAEALGFELVAHADSPVPGGEGTVEILAHVRFAGRPDRLPQPGERRRGAERPAVAAAAATALAGELSWFAVVAPGAEAVAAREAALVPGARDVRAVAGGVELRGAAAVGMAANLWLRVPTRILLRLGGAVEAREFGKLRHRLARLPWEAFVAPATPLRIAASAHRCRLYHTGALDETVRLAIGDRLGTAPPPAPPSTARAKGASGASDDVSRMEERATANDEPPDAAPMVLLRGEEDRFTVSVDSSGERLHRRGWRLDGGEAPLRETLAAALLALADWRPDEPLCDPMCGGGTIAIEAAALALSVAPGLHRGFAFERWPGLTPGDRGRWQAERAGALASRRPPPPPAPIAASDRDPGAVAGARRNAARAGLDGAVEISERALDAAIPPAPAGLLIANPPYGARLGRRSDLPALYRQIGRLLGGPFRGWRAAIVVPDPTLASAFRRPVRRKHAIAHGGLRVTLVEI